MKLGYLAERLVIGSQELTPAAKLVWLVTHGLDQGPDGCYLGAEAMAERTGMGVKNVKRCRAELMTSGLMTNERRTGRRTACWYAAWPATVPLPTSGKLSPEQMRDLRAMLDGAIRIRREDTATPVSRDTLGHHDSPVTLDKLGHHNGPRPSQPAHPNGPVEADRAITVALDRAITIAPTGPSQWPHSTRAVPEEVDPPKSDVVVGGFVRTPGYSARADARASSQRSHERGKNNNQPEPVGDVLRRIG